MESSNGLIISVIMTLSCARLMAAGDKGITYQTGLFADSVSPDESSLDASGEDDPTWISLTLSSEVLSLSGNYGSRQVRKSFT